MTILIDPKTAAYCEKKARWTKLIRANANGRLPLPGGTKVLMIWREGRCMVYSTDSENTYWPVPDLDDEFWDWTMPFTLCS